jgi:hypothetical protein
MKKKGLLVWFEIEQRPELIQPFISMSDRIEFVQLYYRNEEDRKINTSPFKMIFWFNYSSPFKILKEIKPDFIIGVTEGLMEISLINAARELRIPYYGLQHGFTPDNMHSLLPEINRPSVFGLYILKKYLKILWFYITSTKNRDFRHFIERMRFVVSFYKMNPLDAIAQSRYKWLKPTGYICFSEVSSTHCKKLYDLTETEIKYIGIPWFDQFFAGVRKGNSFALKEKYYILIDTNFEEYHTLISKEKIWRCYHILNNYCIEQNAKLYIKLHPWSYKYDFEDTEYITFIRNIDMENLGRIVSDAKGCFGFYSTLTMPIAFIKPTIQIQYDDVVERGLVQNNITPVLDFNIFQLEDIDFEKANHNDKLLEEKYLFSTNGNSAERIENILLMKDLK